MQCPEWLFGGSQGWGMMLHWLWAMPFIFIVSGVICVLFFMWRTGTRAMHPLSGWHLPHMPNLPFAHESAQQILDRRYASGEITRDQYEEMKTALRQWEHKPSG